MPRLRGRRPGRRPACTHSHRPVAAGPRVTTQLRFARPALLRHLAPAAELAPPGGMLALEDQIHAAPTGLRYTWSELIALADALAQVIDGLFVGAAPDEPPPRRGPEADLRRRGRIILEAHDSAL